jgi:hypothetical protein
MAEEGYLQNKIRELQEELSTVKTELESNKADLKRLESSIAKIDFQKLYSMKTQLEDTEKFKEDVIKTVVNDVLEINKVFLASNYQKMVDILKNKLTTEVYPFIKIKMQESTVKTMELVTNSMNNVISNLNKTHNLNIHLLEHTKTVFSEEEAEKLQKRAEKKHIKLNAVNNK